MINSLVVVTLYYWEYSHNRSGWIYIWFTLKFCWYDKPFTEPSYHDDGLVDRWSISTHTGKIYKFLCRILPVLSNKVNRSIIFLCNFDSIHISSNSRNNWGWYRHDRSLHNISSFSYQTRVPIKIHMLDNESRAALKRKTKGMGFMCQMVPTITILKIPYNSKYRHYMIFFCWVCAYLTSTVPWNCGTLFRHKQKSP